MLAHGEAVYNVIEGVAPVGVGAPGAQAVGVVLVRVGLPAGGDGAQLTAVAPGHVAAGAGPPVKTRPLLVILSGRRRISRRRAPTRRAGA